ncbi:glycosyltransferase family 4 protein [candidate division KSB1 bacterium]|nr:glycosyltransferase family 4 protein [candidate division KSB1 bacterium]
MKIIQSCGSDSWGGLEMQTLKIAVALQKKGHDVKILCQRGSKLAQEAVEEGVTVNPIHFKGLAMLASIKKLIFLFKNWKPDVIHTHLSHDLWMLVPALIFTGSKAKLFMTKRMASGVKKKDILHRILYGRISTVFAISNYIRQSVLNTCPVTKDKVCLMHNGISLERFNPSQYDRNEVKKEFDIKDDVKIIGMIGRFTPGKGHEQFLQAAKLIKKSYSLPVKFFIVGGASYGEDDYKHYIERLASQLLAPQDYLFTGFRTDIGRIMSALDILAFPSHEESLGNILLEAMAMKVPIVASNGGGVPDIIINGECGLLAQSKSAEELAAGLLKLLTNAELCGRFSAQGRIRVERFFNFDRYITSLESYYLQPATAVMQQD